MADYYSHRDPRQKGDKYLDYDTGSGGGWIWAGVVLVAIVALIGLGASSTDDGAATASGGAPQAIDNTATIDTPPAVTPATE